MSGQLDNAKAEIAKLCEEVVLAVSEFVKDNPKAIPEELAVVFFNEKIVNMIVYGSVGESLLSRCFNRTFVELPPIDLNESPLTLAVIHQMVMSLCVNGQAHVINCSKDGAGRALYLLQLMRKNLSEEDLQEIRGIVAAEIAKRAPR
jgi:hypothetical protein